MEEWKRGRGGRRVECLDGVRRGGDGGVRRLKIN